MKKGIITLLIIAVEYITLTIYNEVTYSKFMVAFIGGGIDAFILAGIGLYAKHKSNKAVGK